MKDKKDINYYDEINSYIKEICEKKGNEMQCTIMKSAYNNILSNMNEDEINKFLMEMVIITSLFENKLYQMNNDKKEEVFNLMYESYLLPITICYSNNDIICFKKLFYIMNERMKELLGYYGLKLNFAVNQKVNIKSLGY